MCIWVPNYSDLIGLKSFVSWLVVTSSLVYNGNSVLLIALAFYIQTNDVFVDVHNEYSKLFSCIQRFRTISRYFNFFYFEIFRQSRKK